MDDRHKQKFLYYKKNTLIPSQEQIENLSNGWYLLIEGESIMSFLFGGKLFSLLFNW
jgi:hypothetical protein